MYKLHSVQIFIANVLSSTMVTKMNVGSVYFLTSPIMKTEVPFSKRTGYAPTNLKTVTWFSEKKMPIRTGASEKEKENRVFLLFFTYDKERP